MYLNLCIWKKVVYINNIVGGRNYSEVDRMNI